MTGIALAAAPTRGGLRPTARQRRGPRPRPRGRERRPPAAARSWFEAGGDDTSGVKLSGVSRRRRQRRVSGPSPPPPPPLSCQRGAGGLQPPPRGFGAGPGQSSAPQRLGPGPAPHNPAPHNPARPGGAGPAPSCVPLRRPPGWRRLPLSPVFSPPEGCPCWRASSPASTPPPSLPGTGAVLPRGAGRSKWKLSCRGRFHPIPVPSLPLPPPPPSRLKSANLR